MAVVSAFGVLEGTQRAGMTAYYRAPGCDEVTIADALPILSKIIHYNDEYIIGEMLIWDTGEQSAEPNNCAMVKVIVYNDGWICTWFEKTTQNQLALGMASFIDAQTLSGWGTSLEYKDKFNGCNLEITGSTDPACPVGTIFTIRFTDYSNGYITVHNNEAQEEHFNSGYSYAADIYMTNGNFLWWGNTGQYLNIPPYNSNRLYRCIYQIWDVLKYSSNSSNVLNGNATLVYMYNSQTDVYTNETTDFNDIGTDDCQIFPTTEVIDDAFYIGSSNKFNGISITMGTPGAGSGITWEYYDGSMWSTLVVVDGSLGFTSTGDVTFDPMDDWTPTFVDSQLYFWVRARVTTASYTVTPLLTQGQLYIQQDVTYIATELGVYNFEYTSANYVLLCGRTDIPAYSSVSHDYYYNTVLPGKVIYDHQMSASSTSQLSSSQGYVNYNGITMIHNNIFWNANYGYYILDLNDIDYSPGTQNVIHHYGYRYAQYAQYIKSGTVLIVS